MEKGLAEITAQLRIICDKIDQINQRLTDEKNAQEAQIQNLSDIMRKMFSEFAASLSAGTGDNNNNNNTLTKATQSGTNNITTLSENFREFIKELVKAMDSRSRGKDISYYIDALDKLKINKFFLVSWIQDFPSEVIYAQKEIVDIIELIETGDLTEEDIENEYGAKREEVLRVFKDILYTLTVLNYDDILCSKTEVFMRRLENELELKSESDLSYLLTIWTPRQRYIKLVKEKNPDIAKKIRDKIQDHIETISEASAENLEESMLNRENTLLLLRQLLSLF